MDLEQRVERLELLMIRLVTGLGPAVYLAADIYQMVGEIVRELDERIEQRNS